LFRWTSRCEGLKWPEAQNLVLELLTWPYCQRHCIEHMLLSLKLFATDRLL
jgi:hypothetical protein